MLCASFSRSPVAPVRDRRSEPARSTRFRTPRVGAPEASTPVRFSVNTMCDRDEWSFIFVARVVRAAMARRTSESISRAEFTATDAACVTLVSPVRASCFTSCFTVSSVLSESRSLISSL
jgi:hypothetical protein